MIDSISQLPSTLEYEWTLAGVPPGQLRPPVDAAVLEAVRIGFGEGFIPSVVNELWIAADGMPDGRFVGPNTFRLLGAQEAAAVTEERRRTAARLGEENMMDPNCFWDLTWLAIAVSRNGEQTMYIAVGSGMVNNHVWYAPEGPWSRSLPFVFEIWLRLLRRERWVWRADDWEHEGMTPEDHGLAPLLG